MEDRLQKLEARVAQAEARERISRWLAVASLAVVGLLATKPAVTQGNDVPKPAQFSAVEIKQGLKALSALDFRLTGRGRAIRFYAPVAPLTNPPVEQKDPVAYFNDSGQMYTKGWLVISGVSTGTGEGYNIEHPTQDPSMLAVWSDVLGPAIQVRAAYAGAESYLFQGLDRKANYTFSIEQNGALRWGAAARAAMDANLYRSAPNTLKTDGSLHVSGSVQVGGSQSVRRTAVAADYALSDSDYYLGVTDTLAPRTVTLPAASGKAGRVYVVKDESGGAGTRPIAIRARSGETIDGAATRTIGASYGVLRLICTGSHWFSM